MGNCFCCIKEREDLRVALKLPNGIAGLQYASNSGSFIRITSLDDWLHSLYEGSSWTNWLVYNDETGHLDIKGQTKGHCKGILAWNDKSISWLIHSVPNFPRVFTGNTISNIEPGEHIYGQSFCYTQCSYTAESLREILQQLSNMEPHIYIKKMTDDVPKPEKKQAVRQIVFADKIWHLSKSSHHRIDFYSEHLCIDQESLWYVETWKRGSKIKKSSQYMRDIESLKFDGIEYKESQDHSKWAASTEFCFIGDLNRMESQSKRGGGGILIHDPKMACAFRGLVDEVIVKV